MTVVRNEANKTRHIRGGRTKRWTKMRLIARENDIKHTLVAIPLALITQGSATYIKYELHLTYTPQAVGYRSYDY